MATSSKLVCESTCCGKVAKSGSFGSIDLFAMLCGSMNALFSIPIFVVAAITAFLYAIDGWIAFPPLVLPGWTTPSPAM